MSRSFHLFLGQTVSRVIVTQAVPSHSKETFQSIAIPIIERAKQLPKACFLGNCIQFNGLVLQTGQFHISANLVLMSYYNFQPIKQCCPYIGVKVYFSSPFWAFTFYPLRIISYLHFDAILSYLSLPVTLACIRHFYSFNTVTDFTFIIQSASTSTLLCHIL